MTNKEREMLEYEWELGLQVIVDYEDETPEFLANLDIGIWESDNLSDVMDPVADTEGFWRASFELANALGLAMIKIDEDGNIKGDWINY